MTTESRAETSGKYNRNQADLPDDRWLLDDFQTGDFFFASPTQQYRGRAKDGLLSAYQPVDRAVVESLFKQAAQHGVDQPLMFGLIPFDASGNASLAIPLRWEAADIPGDLAAVQPQGGTRPKIVQ